MTEQSGPSLAPAAALRTAPVALWAIFLLFLWMGLVSFGGGLTGWLYREVVLKRGWLGRDDFFSGLAFGQIMPGTNISNLTVFIGQHLRGLPGAATALAGLLIGPFFAVLALYSVYGAVAEAGQVQYALDGVASAALGLLLVVAAEGARAASRRIAPLLAFLATFGAIGLLQWPMVPVVVGVAIPSVLWAAMRRRS